MATLPPVIVGTAGHVDHGKTELIRALTGVETDRLREEKERGISIDLGFAPFRLPSGRLAGVVDVPGHERFIHNMLAGVGGMDLVLLVIDVMEGVMPQTREHLQILELLGIQHGIVVLTKVDLAESSDWVDLVEEEVREELAGTFLETAPCCRVASPSKQGIPELVKTIEGILKAFEAKDASGPLRLPVDRHFSVAGFGTVVTGTLLSGSIHPGDTIEILPPGKQLRVREIQVHGKKTDGAQAGQRVALNIAGLERDQIKRGAVIGTPGIFEQTERLDARLTLLPEAPRPLKFRDPVHFYLGTARVVGLVALLDRDQLEPGESALVQIHLDRPLVAHRQDRFIIRSYSPMTTIGGGQVIDPAPVKHRRFRDDVLQALADLESGERSFLLQKIAAQGCVRTKDLEGVAGLGSERIQDHLEALSTSGTLVALADQWTTTEQARAWSNELCERVKRFHAEQPLQPGMPHATLKAVLPGQLSVKGFDALLAPLLEESTLVRQDDLIAAAGHSVEPPAEIKADIERLATAYRDTGMQANNRREMCEKIGLPFAKTEPLYTFLHSNGTLVRLNEEISLHHESYERALEILRQHFGTQETLTLAEFRDKIGSARKQTQALLEHFDGLKYTMRKGDARVAWKLPKPA
ncbi:MAG: selenocysteine-specific translation elongation factor [Desulfuromonas sp.]|nr:MAG: selenocysteine-specific translation elongation factor [Desulfuromonas sp.]